ncbi:MAG: GNAT family N-acetyltransferase [Acidobacteriaceae bacterium]
MSEPKQRSDASGSQGETAVDLRTKHIRIAPVTMLADFEQCVDVQLAVWGYSDSDLIPKRVFIVAERIGGQVLGAYNGKVLVGFAMAFPGYRDGRPYLHSHMLAVLSQYRNAGLGRRLKLAQRDDALARGFELMEWTFDPLEIKNAHLNIARLGAIARRYLRNIYGPSTSPLQGGLPTDRLVVEWWLRSERVRRVLGEEASGEKTKGEETAEQAAGDEVVERIDVPCIIHDWKRDPKRRSLAESLQTRNRLILESAFARGLAITGYERCTNGDGFFLLGRVSGL